MKEKGRYSKIAMLADNALLSLIKDQWDSYKKIYNKYPTSQEIDDSKDMVTSKTIQRRFGGVKNCRKLLNHSILNYSQGKTRSDTSSNSMALSINDENEMQAFLVSLFGNRPNVCGQEPYVEFNNIKRSNFGVYHKDGHFFVEIFTAKDKWSLSGCINHKQKKLIGLDIKDTVYFVAKQTLIDSLVKNKKNKLPPNVVVISDKNFKNFCKTLKPNVQL